MNEIAPENFFIEIMESSIENMVTLAKEKWSKNYTIKKVDYDGAQINLKDNEIKWPYYDMETVAKKMAIIVLGVPSPSFGCGHHGTIDWVKFNRESDFELWQIFFGMSQKFIVLHEICHALFPREKLNNITNQKEIGMAEEFWCDIQASHLLFKGMEKYIRKNKLSNCLLSDIYISMRMYWFCKDNTGTLDIRGIHPPAICRVGYSLNYALALQQASASEKALKLEDYERKEAWLLNRIKQIGFPLEYNSDEVNKLTDYMEHRFYAMYIDYDIDLK